MPAWQQHNENNFQCCWKHKFTPYTRAFATYTRIVFNICKCKAHIIANTLYCGFDIKVNESEMIEKAATITNRRSLTSQHWTSLWHIFIRLCCCCRWYAQITKAKILNRSQIVLRWILKPNSAFLLFLSFGCSHICGWTLRFRLQKYFPLIRNTSLRSLLFSAIHRKWRKQCLSVYRNLWLWKSSGITENMYSNFKPSGRKRGNTAAATTSDETRKGEFWGKS